MQSRTVLGIGTCCGTLFVMTSGVTIGMGTGSLMEMRMRLWRGFEIQSARKRDAMLENWMVFRMQCMMQLAMESGYAMQMAFGTGMQKQTRMGMGKGMEMWCKTSCERVMGMQFG